MDTTTTPETEATPSTDGAKRARPPLDAAARDAQAKKRAVARLIKKAKSAKDVDELRSLMTGEAARATDAKEADATKQQADPADVPIKKGWPTPRKIAEAEPLAAFILQGLGEFTAGTRYDLATPCKTPGGGEIPRAALLMQPLTCALASMEAPELSPGAAFAVTAGMLFGPTAVAHFFTEGVPLIKATLFGKKPEAARPKQGDAASNARAVRGTATVTPRAEGPVAA